MCQFERGHGHEAGLVLPHLGLGIFGYVTVIIFNECDWYHFYPEAAELSAAPGHLKYT